jgi:LmbE family N-acetylglucosaminyl deacetylase
MVVHAHPDDESIGTGGILARYAAEGVRTVLVTCTDGGCGDGPDGVKPGQPGHDRAAVVAARREELEQSCKVLGVTHLERLDYADSGMMGWPQNDEPGSFWRAPVGEGAARLAELFRRYSPQVVVTYNANGFYGHPDHIQAHRITVAASELTGIPSKLYYTAVPRSAMAEFGRRLQELGIEFEDAGTGDTPAPESEHPAPESEHPAPEWEHPAPGSENFAPGSDHPGGDAAPEGRQPGPREEWLTPDEEITTIVEVSGYTDQKFDSLQCHASQSDNIFFLRMGRHGFGELMGHEAFVRAVDRTGAELPEVDLFAGLRGPAARAVP